MKRFFLMLIILTVFSACKANKKNRCNTCPKWEDRIEMTGEVASEKLDRP
jgi:hypothetical protein